MKLYTIRSANLGAEVKITTNWYDEATPTEIDEAAGVAELRLQRDKLLAAAKAARNHVIDVGARSGLFREEQVLLIKLLTAAIALCDAAEATDA